MSGKVGRTVYLLLKAVMKKKQNPPFEAGQYFNLTGVGMIFGLSAVEMGEKLKTYGLREDLKPTELAIANGFVKEFNTPEKPSEIKYGWQYLKRGEKYWRWSTDRITLLLVQEGCQMVYRRKKNTYQDYIQAVLDEGRKTHILRPVKNVLEAYDLILLKEAHRSSLLKKELHV